MTRIAQVDDRGSAVAWSPVKSHADVIALGAKDSGGIGFDDYGGELELYDLDICAPEGGHPSPRPVGSVKTTSRFSSIGWSPGSGNVSERFAMGLIAGGMIDGAVCVWDPAAMMGGGGGGGGDDGDDPLVATVRRHAGGAVSALQFNPHPASSNLLATGGSDGEVLVTSLEDPSDPNVCVPAPDQPKRGAEVTQVAWNTQVSHILASSGGDGAAVVWDLRQKKPWCELRCEASGAAVSDLAWNPSQGLHVCTASSDDRSPALKLWDLRASTTMPLATLEGHGRGVLSLGWCPHDDSLLASCGTDNRTILWDLFTLKPIGDVPNDDGSADSDGPATNVYGGIGQSQQKRYDVRWSPLLRGVVSTCSFDRKVQAHSVIGLATRCGRPPAWLKPSSGVTTGFGGTVLSFNTSSKSVSISSFVEEAELRAASAAFESSVSGGDYTGFCDSMSDAARTAGDAHEARVWGFMRIIFEENARAQLLQYLGFDPEEIGRRASEFEDDPSSLADGVGRMSVKERASGGATPAMSPAAERAVHRALLVGNFDAAVECCFRSGDLADALVLASCGGADLWARTQARYFESEASRRPFLSVVSAVIHSRLGELVDASDPERWQETLAILSTYGKSDEFPGLCLALGDRLEGAGDARNASLCYMCALRLDRAAGYWKYELEQANKAKGETDLLALHLFVQKVSVYLQALDPGTSLEPDVAALFYDYAKALSDQGLFATAAKYCRSESQECKELRDRLYRCKDSHLCLANMGGTPPEFPYTNERRAGVVPASSRPRQQQHQQQEQQQQAAQTSQPAAAQYNQQQAAAAAATGGAQHGQQQQHAAANQTQQASTAAPRLPPGWAAIQDPTSGRTYYANQTTGESSWEMPRGSAPAPAPAPQATTNGSAASAAAATTPTTPAKLASKYGDGFVTSASHPELAERYGNTGTSGAYLGASRPGTAAVGAQGAASASAAAPAPASGTFDPNRPPEVSAEHKPTVDGLMGLVGSLSRMQLGANERRQLSEVQRGVAVFTKRLGGGEIDPGIASKVSTLVGAVQNRDYRSAGAVQTALVNSDWREHKDWLKGMKFLVQLAGKKLY